MFYQQTSTPDLDRIKDAVADLLAVDLRHVEIAFENRGYSGGVHRLVVQDAHGVSYPLLLKRGPADKVYRFFQEVLAPYGLNSPRMHGVIEGGDASYLVMEYIPHEPPDWNDPAKYRRAIDWLAYKDRVAEPQLDRIAQLDYVRPFDLGSLSDRAAVIRAAAEERLDPLLSERLAEVVENNGHRFEEARARVLWGPQTVVHNDFQMLNILFATGPRRGQLYVVDWTYPAIGSVCIDLATLVHVAPAEIRSELIQRYREARPVADFPAQFAAAQMHVHLSILTWMVDALGSGHEHAVARPKMHELVNEIANYFEQ